MQIVYLSNRPKVLAETWDHVRTFMPFVDRALVIAPGSMHDQFGLDGADGVTLADESAISGLTAAQIGGLDHVRRNVTLRRAAIGSDLVDDVFLLSDDDYRPIKPIDPSFFTEDGLDRSYYFHDLDSWTGYGTDYDEAQRRTGQVLSYLGAPRRAYGSHQPQIMRKDLWEEAFAIWDNLRGDNMVCEWALYFNLARQNHPEQFAADEVYRTMCWPPHVHEFPLRHRPPEYQFENFYPESYSPGHLFAGLPTAVDPADLDGARRNAVEKLVRWSELGFAVGRLDFSGGIAEPWTRSSAVRRLVFRMLWVVRKAYEYASLEERAELSLLRGDVERLGSTTER